MSNFQLMKSSLGVRTPQTAGSDNLTRVNTAQTKIKSLEVEGRSTAIQFLVQKVESGMERGCTYDRVRRVYV